MSSPGANWTGEFWVVVVNRSYFRFTLKGTEGGEQHFFTALNKIAGGRRLRPKEVA